MLIRIPQVGGVIIGNNVKIDALSTVNSGTIEPTVIEDNVMIGYHVTIAHNDIIKSGCIITGGLTVAGSVTIGKGILRYKLFDKKWYNYWGKCINRNGGSC